MAVGWDIYERTHSTTALGLVGLVLMIPVLLLSLLFSEKASGLGSQITLLAAF